MSPETTAARRVGALVLAALAVLALAVLLIGDRQNLFQPKNRYFVRFVSVVGLRQGSDVQLNGVNVGSVERIVLPADTGENLLEVWITVDARYEQRIRRDSVARIKTLGLLGDKYLELTSGSPATEPIPEEGEIPAAPPTNARTAPSGPSATDVGTGWIGKPPISWGALPGESNVVRVRICFRATRTRALPPASTTLSRDPRFRMLTGFVSGPRPSGSLAASKSAMLATTRGPF